MSKIKTLFSLLKSNPKQIRIPLFSNISKTGILNCLTDKAYLKLAFKTYIGKKLDLKNPQSFNEKLQWLKLYDRKKEYVTMVDKYAVREYIKKQIGEEYLIPLLNVYNSVDEIDLEKLPERFVLKCSHDSGSVVICKDKSIFNFEAAKKKLERKLKKDMFFFGREWPYKGIPRKIVAEQFMEDKENEELKDYKFFCFNGNPEVVLVCSDRFAKGGLRENFYDTSWNLLPVKRPAHPNSDKKILPPKNLKQMLELAKKLSKDIPFTRIDFYDINNKIYFGEITFFPASGFEAFEPEEWDYKLGSWITLPEKMTKR